MRVAYPLIVAVATALVLPLAAAELAGQQPPAKVAVFGSVTDVDTGEPVAGATVRLPGLGRSVLSNEEGRFVLEEVPEGPQRLEVSRLGYTDLSGEVDLVESGQIVVSLISNEIALEGITVQVNRIRGRRNTVGISTRAFEHQQLSVLAPQTALDFVRAHGNLHPGGSCALGAGYCAFVRGRLVPVSVFIDERPAIGGLEDLRLYPVQEFALVELYGGGHEVRVYTPQFLDRLAQGKASLFPFILR